ncbi:unnamed protein product [Ixodes pacificus]
MFRLWTLRQSLKDKIPEVKLTAFKTLVLPIRLREYALGTFHSEQHQ